MIKAKATGTNYCIQFRTNQVFYLSGPMTFLVGNASGRDSCKATDTNSGIQFAECEERGSRY